MKWWRRPRLTKEETATVDELLTILRAREPAFAKATRHDIIGAALTKLKDSTTDTGHQERMRLALASMVRSAAVLMARGHDVGFHLEPTGAGVLIVDGEVQDFAAIMRAEESIMAKMEGLNYPMNLH